MNASSHSLKAESREVIGKKSRHLRRTGVLPAVVYGHQQKSIPVSVNQLEFEKLYRETGNSTLVDLKVDDKPAHKVLIQDVQYNPVRRDVLHVDFYRVNMKEKLRTEVTLEFIGSSDAIDQEGGSLLTTKSEVEIECLPDDLIPHLSVDISSMKNLGDILRIKDLEVPKGIVILDDEDEVVASIAAPRSEEELAELESEIVDQAATVESETTSGTETPAEKEAEDKE